jgi:hypothetical protein
MQICITKGIDSMTIYEVMSQLVFLYHLYTIRIISYPGHLVNLSNYPVLE